MLSWGALAGAAQRPRLHDDVIVRRHLSEHDDLVVLHDERSRRVLKILPVQWSVLALADGTRDVEGIVLAAKARGIEASAADLEEFLAHLAEQGVLASGVAEPAEDDPDPDADLARAPLDPIDGWRFVCSGRGACCHVFPTILFTPIEAARALVLLPDEAHEFFPKRGSVREGAPVAPLLVEGRCRYLDEGARCQLHTIGGAAAKPAGCRAFPMQMVFDGERVRAAAAYECACVADGIGASAGERPIPDGARALGDLAHPTRVGRVPERVVIAGDRTASRDEVRAFYRALADASAHDVAIGLWAVADAIDARGLDGPAAAFEARTLDLEAPLALLGRLARCLEEWRTPLAAFRSPNDLTRKAFEWMIAAARAIEREPSWRTPDARKEAFYARASAWVCRDALGKLPLATALRVRAIRVWLARALASDDPLAAEPLAIVEVMFRAHGLDAFAT